jgi:hypothetical protein
LGRPGGFSGQSLRLLLALAILDVVESARDFSSPHIRSVRGGHTVLDGAGMERPRGLL